jgi:hypothetical protein
MTEHIEREAPYAVNPFLGAPRRPVGNRPNAAVEFHKSMNLLQIHGV